MSSIRCESKHRVGKLTSKTSFNRTNVCRTIAIKDQLRLNYRFMIQDDSILRIYDPDSIKIQLKKNLSEIDELFNVSNLPEHLKTREEFATVRCIDVDGTTISINDALMLPSEEGPLFYEIKMIIVNEDEVIIVSKWLYDVYYDIMLNAYKIMSELYSYKILDISDLYSCQVTHRVQICNGCAYIVKNWV